MSVDSSVNQAEVRPHVNGRQETTGAMLADWVRVAESKTRIKQMNRMTRSEVGFNMVENYLSNLEDLKYCKRGQGRPERQILQISMGIKIKDEKRRLRDLKRKKDETRDLERETLGQESNKYRKKMKYLHREANKRAGEMTVKYETKIRHLMDKHKTEQRKVPMAKRETRPKKHIDRFPDLHIYKTRGENDDLEMLLDNSKGAQEVLVIGDPELSMDERMTLRLPPGMTVNPKIDLKGFYNDSEQSMAKVRMSLKKEDECNYNQKSMRDAGMAF